MKSITERYFSSEKDKNIIKNILSAFIIKGAGLLISFLSLPAFIKYFDNQEVLGVWFTIFSVLIWILTFDLGIGNGLRNKLVTAIVENDKNEIKRNVSSAYFIIGAITIVVISIALLIFPLINWNGIFNISESLVSAKTMDFVIICAFITVMLQFVLRLVSFILYALQKSAINNFLVLITSLFQLLFVLLAPSYGIEMNLIVLSIVYLLCVNIPLIIATIYVFKTDLKGCFPSVNFVNIQSAKEIMALGGIFFWNQIMYMAITQTNLILITNHMGPENVVDYQIYYKIFMLIGMLFTLALTPMWSAITKAMAEKDGRWIIKYFKLLNKLIIIVVFIQFLSIPFTQLFVNLWLGESTIEISYKNALIFAGYGSVFILQNVLSTFACGLSKMKLQAYFYTFGFVLKILLVYLLTKLYTDWIIIVCIDIAILLPYCIFEWFSLKKKFNTLSVS